MKLNAFHFGLAGAATALLVQIIHALLVATMPMMHVRVQGIIFYLAHPARWAPHFGFSWMAFFGGTIMMMIGAFILSWFFATAYNVLARRTEQ